MNDRESEMMQAILAEFDRLGLRPEDLSGLAFAPGSEEAFLARGAGWPIYNAAFLEIEEPTWSSLDALVIMERGGSEDVLSGFVNWIEDQPDVELAAIPRVGERSTRPDDRRARPIRRRHDVRWSRQARAASSKVKSTDAKAVMAGLVDELQVIAWPVLGNPTTS